ncbi:glycine betaine ABC transporter substrate-binding protein [Planococcus salinarum]|uniref:glycine betaine ABC transporter substrate-binding protein n=1 Tax=Planococcus salinarum TaxID=622695 RepID=UPI000E3E7854|nr:glycine betaine ABC transporter substrate-binding protein [Planococcus salinarum]TAA73383.1 glycine/betaine ABC transporter [Planococcus salinarum]
MKKVQWKHLGLVFAAAPMMFIAACGDEEAGTEEGTAGESGEVNYGEELGYEITGIEPGAGVVAASETATEEYESLEGWEVVTSSSGAMATELGAAIDKEEPIIVTGWSPHWKFQKYDLKYLEDPNGVFGGEESIKTMARKGLEEENPEAFKVIDQFQWETADIESVMLEVSDGADVEEAAATWIEANSDKVAEWTDGTEAVDGMEIELAYVEWDTEVASTNVLGQVLEAQGFDVTMTPLDNAVMWSAVAEGQADAMVAAWLPATHASQFEKYGEDVVDLGENLTGAKVGFVVPSYMDIDSIEDLTPAE